ncbi:MAG: hypothetical protein ABFD89_28075, partial [Bryobacteraceae bacterium]
VIALRGSVTLEDWWHDLQAVADPHDHDGLGPVHAGFADHMEATWKDVQRYTAGPRVVIGHSLGAARAAILTGLMVLADQPPLARVVWGEPLSGFRQLADLISAVPARSYRNGDWRQHDPVTDLPIPTPHLPYYRAQGLVDICVPPKWTLFGSWHRFPLIGWHDMQLYAKGTPNCEIARLA